MTILHLMALALIQGLTEFLPVSSSGHLILFSKIFHLKDQGLSIDVALHIGSLLAVMIYFGSEILKMFSDVFKTKLKPDFKLKYNKLAWLIVVGSIPALVAGFCLRHIAGDFLRNPKIIGVTILFYGILLYVADRFSKAQKKLEDIGLKEAILIGLAQCLALIPGTSRSGITITAARFLHINRVDSAKFSMLLLIPVIVGAGALEIYRLYITGSFTDTALAIKAVCFSFVISYAVIYLMLRWLQKFSFLPFVIYRVVLGLLLLALF